MIIVLILTLIPVIIWTQIAPLSARFTDLNMITTSIGQILGLLGMTLFSINLILAGRFKWLDQYFKGLDKVYQNHSVIGMLAFSLILFHPLFLVISYLSLSANAAALFFVPFINWPITWGVLSLTLMIGLLVLTLYLKLKYHIWKFSHKFLTLAFILAVIHTLTIASDITRSNLLRYYIITLSIIGLMVSIRQGLFRKIAIKKVKYSVVNVTALNDSVVEIEMAPMEKKINFTPGQFCFFNFESKDVSFESHPFSISGSANECNLKITVKNLGDFTETLKNLKIGDRVLIDGPYGQFSPLNLKSKKQIWIAGGIGVTPFLSMMATLPAEYQIDFYYSVKDKGEAIRIKDLEELSEKNPNFKFILWSAKDRGYISGQAISQLSQGLSDKEILFCGPSGFMASLNNQFQALGISKDRIHYENFNFLNL